MSPPLLLLSASSRFPQGLANSSGLVGKYVTTQGLLFATVDAPNLEIFPGIHVHMPVQTRKYYRCALDRPYVRHDLWMEEPEVRAPPFQERGSFSFGDDLLKRWRAKNARPGARVRMYVDVHPDRNSEIVLDSSRRNRWGDPVPKVAHRVDEATMARLPTTDQHVGGILGELARIAGGKPPVPERMQRILSHHGGGCRMGTDPATSVCDSYGRTHDHQNLYVVGAATMPTSGCASPTLTYVALGQRSADNIVGEFAAG